MMDVSCNASFFLEGVVLNKTCRHVFVCSNGADCVYLLSRHRRRSDRFVSERFLEELFSMVSILCIHGFYYYKFRTMRLRPYHWDVFVQYRSAVSYDIESVHPIYGNYIFAIHQFLVALPELQLSHM